MKTYNEMAKSALERIGEYKKEKKRRRKIFVYSASGALCTCLAVLIAVVIPKFSGNPLQSESGIMQIPGIKENLDENDIIKIQSGKNTEESSDFAELSYKADTVVLAKISDISYVSINGVPFTKAAFETEEVYKGSLAQGDEASFYFYGGYVPLCAESGSEDKFFYQTVMGEDPLETGKTYVFCLSKSSASEGIPQGEYELLSPYARLSVQANGTFVQRIWNDCSNPKRVYTKAELLSILSSGELKTEVSFYQTEFGADKIYRLCAGTK